MPNIDKYLILQKRYNNRFPEVLAHTLNTKGWDGAVVEFDIALSTVGEYIKRAGIERRCVYVVVDEYEREEASA